MTALGAALYHDVYLADDTQPIEALFDALFAGESGLKQFCVPLAPRRERPSAFRREKLLERVSYGVPRREVDTSRSWKSPWDRVRRQRQ